MGNIYVALKTYDQVLDCYLHSLEIRKKCFPPQHIEIAHTNRNIGRRHTIDYRIEKQRWISIDNHYLLHIEMGSNFKIR